MWPCVGGNVFDKFLDNDNAIVSTLQPHLVPVVLSLQNLLTQESFLTEFDYKFLPAPLCQVERDRSPFPCLLCVRQRTIMLAALAVYFWLRSHSNKAEQR
jgi:hypothetical protein